MLNNEIERKGENLRFSLARSILFSEFGVFLAGSVGGIEVKTVEEIKTIEKIKAKTDGKLTGKTDKDFMKITCQKFQGILLDFALFLAIEMVIWGFLGLVKGRHLMPSICRAKKKKHTSKVHTSKEEKNREKWEEENIR